YPHFQDVLKYDGIDFPITMKNIKKFENLNNLAINLYCIENKKILPCCLSSKHDSNRTINLLMLPTNKHIYDENQDRFCDEELLYHFCWIKNLSRLVSKQVSEHGHKIHICERCLNYFKTEQLLENHKKCCKNINNYSLKVPEEGKNLLYFQNYRFQEKVPFAIYADLESILEKCDSSLPEESTSKSSFYQKHTPFSMAYYFKCSYNNSLSKFRLYRGNDCIKWFVNELKSIADYCNNVVNDIVVMENLSERSEEHTSELQSRFDLVCSLLLER